jgi:hypothetical protein
MTSRSLESRTYPTHKVELFEGLGYRRDVLEDGTNILCRNVGDRLLIDAKQHNGKTNTLIGTMLLEQAPDLVVPQTRPATVPAAGSWRKRV